MQIRDEADRPADRAGAAIADDSASVAAELQRLQDELAGLAYAVAHDVRAPIRAIDGFSDALLDDYRARLDGDGVEYLERIRSAAARLETLIGCVVELARVSREPMQPGRVNVSAVCDSIFARLKGSQPDRRVNVSIDPDLVVHGDARLLTLAFEHLIGNAWKFTRRQPNAMIRVGSEIREGRRVVYVRDNGTGFDEAFAGRLFTPFQRLHSSNDFEGNGIGLAIVRRIAHRHRGEVHANSKLGEGSTFCIDLP